MAIIIPSSVVGLPAGADVQAAGMPLASDGIGAGIEDAHCVYAYRLRVLYSRSYSQITGLTTAQAVSSEVPVRTSQASGDLGVVVRGSGTLRVDVTVGAASLTLTGSGLLTGTLTSPGADVDSEVTVTYQSTSGVGIATLRSVTVYEAPLVSIP